MNSKQRTVLMWVGGAIIAALLYPPFAHHWPNGAVSSAGFAFLFAPPSRALVDVGTLLIEWLAVVVVGTIAFVLNR